MISQTADLLRYRHKAMACDWEILIWGESRANLEALCERAFEEVDKLECRLSVFKPGSEICRINECAGGSPVRTDPETFRLISWAREISILTGGAFDVTIGPLVSLWSRCRSEKRLPREEDIDPLREITGFDKLHLDSSNKSVHLPLRAMSLNLGAFGKGYAVDRVIDMLLESGVPGAAVHAGTSSISAFGHAPDGSPWKAAIRHPRTTGKIATQVLLNDESLSTSGDYEQYFEIEGTRYGHVLDPRTLYPAKAAMSASVICESAAAGDALSTAACVIGEEGFSAICREQESIRAIFVNEENVSQ